MGDVLQRVVIAGGGLAAVRTAQTLRDLGHQGEVHLVSEEAELPYDRPPLSKDCLVGAIPGTAVPLLTPAALRRLDLNLRLGNAVAGLRASERTLTLANGASLGYDRLVVATGAQPRPLAHLASSPSVCYLRTSADAGRLRDALANGARLVVLGAGFIGLEVAAAARSRGCAVTVVEVQQAPLVGVIGPELAGWLQAYHADRGVDFRCGVSVDSCTTDADHALVGLSDGSSVDADIVVVGVGVVRDLGWLADAGLETHHGLVCDWSGRTNLPGIFGAGDIVCRHGAQGCSPVAHWSSTVDSARRVAHTILGVEPDLAEDDGFFWSDQYELRLQFAGHPDPEAQISVVSGGLAEGRFVAHLLRGDRLAAVLAVNSPREFSRSRLALREQAARVGVPG